MHDRPDDRRGFIHKRLFGGVKGLLAGGPVAAAAGFVTSGGRSRQPLGVRGGRIITRRAPRTALIPTRGVRGFFQRLIPGGRTGFEQITTKSVGPPTAAQRAAEGLPPRRRMNVANVKALRRAGRRLNGFVKVAARALEGTGWKVVRRTSTKKRSPSVIVESGPGSVVSR